MDGYNATKTIKSTAPGKNTIIIAIPANIADEQSLILSFVGDDIVYKHLQSGIIFEKIFPDLTGDYLSEEITPEI
jgi:CheY-like chemotaxis protein